MPHGLPPPLSPFYTYGPPLYPFAVSCTPCPCSFCVVLLCAHPRPTPTHPAVSNPNFIHWKVGTPTHAQGYVVYGTYTFRGVTYVVSGRGDRIQRNDLYITNAATLKEYKYPQYTDPKLIKQRTPGFHDVVMKVYTIVTTQDDSSAVRGVINSASFNDIVKPLWAAMDAEAAEAVNQDSDIQSVPEDATGSPAPAASKYAPFPSAPVKAAVAPALYPQALSFNNSIFQEEGEEEDAEDGFGTDPRYINTSFGQVPAAVMPGEPSSISSALDAIPNYYAQQDDESRILKEEEGEEDIERDHNEDEDTRPVVSAPVPAAAVPFRNPLSLAQMTTHNLVGAGVKLASPGNIIILLPENSNVPLEIFKGEMLYVTTCADANLPGDLMPNVVRVDSLGEMKDLVTAVLRTVNLPYTGPEAHITAIPASPACGCTVDTPCNVICYIPLNGGFTVLVGAMQHEVSQLFSVPIPMMTASHPLGSSPYAAQTVIKYTETSKTRPAFFIAAEDADQYVARNTDAYLSREVGVSVPATRTLSMHSAKYLQAVTPITDMPRNGGKSFASLREALTDVDPYTGAPVACQGAKLFMLHRKCPELDNIATMADADWRAMYGKSDYILCVVRGSHAPSKPSNVIKPILKRDRVEEGTDGRGKKGRMNRVDWSSSVQGGMNVQDDDEEVDCEDESEGYAGAGAGAGSRSVFSL